MTNSMLNKIPITYLPTIIYPIQIPILAIVKSINDTNSGKVSLIFPEYPLFKRKVSKNIHTKISTK